MDLANSLIVTLTVEDFFKILDEKLEQKLDAKFEQPKHKDWPEWLTRHQVAKYLSISIASVDNYARQGFITKKYIGRKPRFHRDEITELLHKLEK